MDNRFGGEWSNIKLNIVEKYLNFYTQALGKQPYRLIYIDAFAGSGKQQVCDVSAADLFPEYETNSTIDGSVLRALRNPRPFDKYYFIDNDKEKCDELLKLNERFPALDISVKCGDANSLLQNICANLNSYKDRCVAFLDPFGLDIPLDTLKCISATKVVDVWFLFPIGVGVNRLIPNDGNKLLQWQIDKLNCIFGSSDWIDIFYSKESSDTLLFPEDADSSLKNSFIKNVNIEGINNYYLSKLRGVFPAVTDKPKPLINSTNVTLFYLYFAISNEKPKAINLAMKVANDIIERSNVI